jgi:nucleotide-binding universal stress UspA family protein
MYQHILVPLDGSVLAEAALPMAAYWACAFQARVTLLHVIEPEASATVHGERHLTQDNEADTYLHEVARRMFPAGIPVECHVHLEATRKVSQAIVAHQAELRPDLIVMAVHGQHGLREVFFGNLAQQVVAFGDVPLLLVHPDAESRTSPFTCTLILAPTDGKAIHEPGLIVAAEFARKVGAPLHLLSVVPTVAALSGRHATTHRFMPGTTAAMLDMVTEDVHGYLQQQLARMQAEGMVVSAELRNGEPASVIADVAETRKASLVVLGTHGKVGMNAFWNDSLGAKIIVQSKRPFLLVPVKTEQKL